MLPLLLEADDLQQQLARAPQNVLLVDLGKAARYEEKHIPGAQLVTPGETQAGPPVPGFLPDTEALNALFGRLGYQPEQHIVVYDDEGGGWAGRFIWILDEIGHRSYSYLNGGLHAWEAAGLPLSAEKETAMTTQPSLGSSGLFSLSKQDLQSQLGRDDMIVWDARSLGEYTGEKVNAARGGHIPGARHFDWTEAMDTTNALKLKNLDQLRKTLSQRGIVNAPLVVTHCQSHHRSGLTYLLGKLLNFDNIKAYPGSWAEWGNDPDTPIVQGRDPQ